MPSRTSIGLILRDGSLFDRYAGPARCFDCEEATNRAILDGAVHEGDVVVIRYEGPKGGPGMREMYTAMKLLYTIAQVGNPARKRTTARHALGFPTRSV